MWLADDLALDQRVALKLIPRTGDTVGTPHHMSPEQLYGKPPAPASDLYGSG